LGSGSVAGDNRQTTALSFGSLGSGNLIAVADFGLFRERFGGLPKRQNPSQTGQTEAKHDPDDSRHYEGAITNRVIHASHQKAKSIPSLFPKAVGRLP
jgi:hypothetical protein